VFFRSVSDDLKPDCAYRLDLRDRLISYGNSFLDDALVGIAPDDLILIGAPSGAGKTQFCVNIAKACLAQKKRCHFFALEASRYEITRRLKFEIFQRRYQTHHNRPCDFQRWALGQTLPEDAKIEHEANMEFLEKYRGDLKIFYKRGDFGVTQMVERVLQISKKTDLIIIDHVHYFDFDDVNENRAIKEIAKTARDLVLEENVPIILVSHMRKSNNQTYAPSIEDFHGSSDLYKIATTAITVGPGAFFPQTGIAETYVSIVKNRLNSTANRYTGRLAFNTLRGDYEKKYEIGKSQQTREREFKTLEQNDYPRWAKAARSRPVHSGPKKTPAPTKNTRGPRTIPKLPYID